MIRAETLRIHEFRGIRELTLDLAGGNFAVCGPNGTGKSGIVDALEFTLTGTISRLSGPGTGELSVKEHGPHVDSRNKPEAAFVSLKVQIPSLGKAATITRSVKDAKSPRFSPDTPEVRAVFARVALHPEFALSRRELIRYVLSEPGKRSKEVQALLKLDEVESLRALLQRIANSAEREAKAKKAARVEAGESLMRALDIGSLSAALVLQAANEKRAVLELPPLATLEASTSLKDGVISLTSGEKSKIPKHQAKADTEALVAKLTGLSGEEATLVRTSVAQSLEALRADESFLSGASRDSFLRQALIFFDQTACPVCDTPWDPKHFEAHVREKLEKYADASKKRQEVERRLAPLITAVDSLRAGVLSLITLTKSLLPETDSAPLQDYVERLQAIVAALRGFLPIDATLAALREDWSLSQTTASLLANVQAAISALPEPNQQDAARDFLTVGQERLDAFRRATLQLKAADQRAATSADVLNTYAESTTAALDNIYKQVEQFFSRLYRRINQDDEENFEAKLRPSMGKLGFDVDFYGRGFFPPGAYHSEGHQDGMGLCLYLALMNHLAGDAFTFAVLDDVLMSVDSGHRREVSSMLLEEFPNTQFILTTHDEIWLRHMKSTGLIKSKRFAHFRTWNVDLGPTEWTDREVWEELDALLKANDVRAAAALLRHYLEHASKELCQNLRASVEFRGDAQFTLGDLLPQAVSRMTRLLGSAASAAKSWGQADKAKSIQAASTGFSELVSTANVEQWQINAAVHYNEWATLSASEFAKVVSAFRALLSEFSCVKCEAFLHVVPSSGAVESLRCSCGEKSLNLVKK